MKRTQDNDGRISIGGVNYLWAILERKEPEFEHKRKAKAKTLCVLVAGLRS